ncbi:DUF1858 domain-containing protein [Candidatus Woesearchaeota archaeon]|nr:DUF1858 domain-containing protein [Candidatus Woesearchaeota archaeon]
MTFSRRMRIGEAVNEHPGAARIMLSYGLHCVGCHVANWETIEQGCRGHGMPEEMIDELVEELNELAGGDGDVPERAGTSPQD